MATVTSFQLFPPPVPKIKVNANQSARMTKTPTKAGTSPVESLVKSPGAESVIIHIVDDPHEESTLEKVTEEHSGIPSPEPEQERAAASPIDRHNPVPAPDPPLPTSITSSSETLIQTERSQSPEMSPVQPMRSMFPAYNPSLRLSQQQYYPQRFANAPTGVMSRIEYSPSVSSQHDNTLGGPRTAPSSIIDFPTDVLASRGPQFSSPRELEKLWEATNGQTPENTVGGFDLQMARIEDATFTFGATPSLPFYSLQTFDTNELLVSRIHPRRPTKSVPILLLSVEPEARRYPPNDGLVTYIFPKLAAMLAIDQSNELAARHKLAPSEREEMQSDAVARAAAQEACHLVWNNVEERYELLHPAVGRDPERSPLLSSPTSHQDAEHPALQITVQSGSEASSSASAPVILVTNPSASKPDRHSSPADIRTSTYPEFDADDALASLDFTSMTLHISTSRILQVAPSLYSVDSIVSAILAVAVADEATNPIMASMELWSRRPKPPGSVYGGSVYGGSIGGKSYSGSVLYATLAEREEAEEEAKLMRTMHEKDKKGKATKEKTPSWTKKSKAKKGQKTKIMIQEFDLEKYGQYQAGSREGEKLPGPVRGALEIMFVALKFFVWSLTLLVQGLAWLMVSVTRCVTSERF